MAGERKEDITLYTEGTPNGWKVSITLEELGVPYKVHKMSLSKKEQKEDWFLKINPNGRIPAIGEGRDGNVSLEKKGRGTLGGTVVSCAFAVDHGNGDFPVFESGAIMMYLCDRFDEEGKLFPKDGNKRHEVTQWLMFQMGQANFFLRSATEDVQYAKNRYINETKRLYSVLEKRLEDSEWLAGGSFSIADIACFSWVMVDFWGGVSRRKFPKIKAWANLIQKRSAVQKGMDVPQPSLSKMKVARLAVPMLDILPGGKWLLEKMR